MGDWKSYMFAASRHGKDNQIRRYTHEAYVTHGVEVRGVFGTVSHLFPDNEAERLEHVCMMHDLLEDTSTTYEEIRALFGEWVADGVRHLTDKFTHEDFPDMNRAQRKHEEAVRLHKNLTSGLKAVKLADMLVNGRTIRRHDPDFWVVYREEGLQLCTLLMDGHPATMSLGRQLQQLCKTRSEKEKNWHKEEIRISGDMEE